MSVQHILAKFHHVCNDGSKHGTWFANLQSMFSDSGHDSSIVGLLCEKDDLHASEGSNTVSCYTVVLSIKVAFI